MSKRIRILAAAMALCLLSGCSGKEPTDKKKTKKTKKTTTETTEVTEAPSLSESDDTTPSGDPSDTASTDPSDPNATSDPNAVTDPSDPNNTSDPTATTDSASTDPSDPTATSDPSDTSGPAGTTNTPGTWQIDMGEDDPDLPGAPCRDTAEGRKSRELYEQFILKNAKVDCSYFAEYRENSYMLAIPMGELPTESLTIDELSKFIINHLDTARTDIQPTYSYAFIDAGLDGDPELVFSIGGLGVFTIHMIIKAVDGELRLTCALDEWDRNYVYIRSAGLVETDGSSGYNITLQNQDIIDADGRYQKVLTQTVCTDDFTTLDEALAPIDDYYQAHNGEPSLMVSRIEVADKDPVYVAVYFDYVLGFSDTSALNPDLQKVIDTITDLTFVPFDSYYQILAEEFPAEALDSGIIDSIYFHL